MRERKERRGSGEEGGRRQLPDFCLEVSVRGTMCAQGTQKREDSLLTSFGELYWARFLSSEPLQMCVTRSRVCPGNNPDGQE